MLAHHFGVSYQAALYRLKSLRHISHPESLKLLEQEEFGQEYLKAFDMFDDVGDPEHRRYWDRELRGGYCQVEQNPPVLRKDSAGSETENQ